jgi:carbonic anhydrase
MACHVLVAAPKERVMHVHPGRAAGVLALCLSTTACTSSTASGDGGRGDAGAESGAVAAAWSYDGSTGPSQWGSLSVDDALCGNGQNQSPIAIVSAGAAAGGPLAPLSTAYEANTFNEIDTGHTEQATPATPLVLHLASDAYALAQFHMHAPSEHTIDGQRFDAELHLVHKGATGAIVVVAVPLLLGDTDEPLGPYFDDMPTTPTPSGNPGDSISVDLSSLIPANAHYFAYTGSLTTPPCTEGVQWIVVKAPLTISQAELAHFRAAFPQGTNRPMQPLNDRAVAVY